MKIIPKVLLLALLCELAFAGQQSNGPKDSPDNGSQNAPQNRPTLGPAPAPSLNGPHSSSITDAHRLSHVRKIYVERMDNSLNDKLMEGLSKTGRFQIVLEEKEADAVLRGTCVDLPHLKSVHSEVFLSDRATGASIWQDIVRRPFRPPALSKAVDDTAALILGHLTDDVSGAAHK